MGYRDGIFCALLEHGHPMTLDEIAARLHELGMGESEEKLRASLGRAWRGTTALWKDKHEALALDPQHPDVTFLTARYPPPRKREPEVEPRMPGPEVRLMEEELEVALGSDSVQSLSSIRRAMAVLDAVGRPMSLKELNRYVAERGPELRPIEVRATKSWRAVMVTKNDEDRFVLTADEATLAKVRVAVRKGVRAGLRWADQRRIISERSAEREARQAKARRIADAAHRVLVHAYFQGDAARFVGLMDLRSGSTAFHHGPILDTTAWQPACDVLVGLDLDDVGEMLGIDPEGAKWVSLSRRQKTVSFGASAPPLKLTWDRLLGAALGQNVRLSTVLERARALRAGDPDALGTLMARDLEILGAFYWYGVRQGCFWVPRDGIAAQVLVSFGELGDARAADLAEELVGHRVRACFLQEIREGLPWRWVEGVVEHATGYALELRRGARTRRIEILNIVDLRRVACQAN